MNVVRDGGGGGDDDDDVYGIDDNDHVDDDTIDVFRTSR